MTMNCFMCNKKLVTKSTCDEMPICHECYVRGPWKDIENKIKEWKQQNSHKENEDENKKE